MYGIKFSGLLISFKMPYQRMLYDKNYQIYKYLNFCYTLKIAAEDRDARIWPQFRKY